jgi:hypothetical protein
MDTEDTDGARRSSLDPTTVSDGGRPERAVGPRAVRRRPAPAVGAG